MKCKCKRSTDLDYVKAIETRLTNDIWVRALNKRCKFRKDSQILFTVVIF